MNSPDSGAAAVELIIPMLAEYVGTARLVAGGVANRMGFNIDLLEDIQLCLSEVCNRIINELGNRSQESGVRCRIAFIPLEDSLRIDFYIDGADAPLLFTPDADRAEDADGPGGRSRTMLGERLDEREIAEVMRIAFLDEFMDEYIVNPGGGRIVSMIKSKNEE